MLFSWKDNIIVISDIIIYQALPAILHSIISQKTAVLMQPSGVSHLT
jgi:hypothetical protein